MTPMPSAQRDRFEIENKDLELWGILFAIVKAKAVNCLFFRCIDFGNMIYLLQTYVDLYDGGKWMNI